MHFKEMLVQSPPPVHCPACNASNTSFEMKHPLSRGRAMDWTICSWVYHVGDVQIYIHLLEYPIPAPARHKKRHTPISRKPRVVS